MKRYDLVQVNSCYATDHEMERSEDGEWVRYEDAVHALGCNCDCITSGNVNKPKQHGADPHAKNCVFYRRG